MRALNAMQLAIGTVLALAAASAAAQAYPSKPIRLIVPFPAGGVTDIMGRALANKLSISLGQQVMVDNKPGASGAIGAELAAKATPDGYTLVVGNISTLAINAATFKTLPYDPVTSFSAITLIANQPLLATVHPSVPAKNIAELVALAKASPGKLNYGSAGSSIHLAVAFFDATAGISMTHVPYKGSAPAISDLIGGQINVLFDPMSSMLPQVKAGKARALAVTTIRRSSAAPEIPTVAEQGYAGFDVSSWQGLSAPAGTPKDVIDRLNAESVKAIRSPDVQELMKAQGADGAAGTPAEYAAHIKSEVERWKKIARDADVKPE
jgi:tripartite-type tricarboxylate transporter receptor subunit TctC